MLVDQIGLDVQDPELWDTTSTSSADASIYLQAGCRSSFSSHQPAVQGSFLGQSLMFTVVKVVSPVKMHFVLLCY